MRIPRVLRSKTTNFSGAYFAIIAILGAYGVDIPPVAVAGGATLLAVITRYLTKVPMSEK